MFTLWLLPKPYHCWVCLRASGLFHLHIVSLTPTGGQCDLQPSSDGLNAMIRLSFIATVFSGTKMALVFCFTYSWSLRSGLQSWFCLCFLCGVDLFHFPVLQSATLGTTSLNRAV